MNATEVGTHVAHNYDPLPVTIIAGEGVWLHDDRGRRYLDMLAGYSALSFGHRHPRLVAAATEQLGRLTLTSRAVGNDQLEPFAEALASLCGKEAVLPMNTGAEAVETAIKAARRWAYRTRGVPPGEATIVVFDGNFHGRTTTIVGFSSDESARADFGPFTPGFRSVAFGDIEAVDAAIDHTTAAVLVEPIQGEAGVIIPPSGFLTDLRDLCLRRGVLMLADEIQSGLGRTGRTFASDHEAVRPDLYLVGKALGGGIVALSAVVGDWDVLGHLEPGSHGSTFGGNPLACAIGREVVAMLETGEAQRHAAALEPMLMEGLRALPESVAAGVRGRGLWAAIDLGRAMPGAREVSEALLDHGLIVKRAHGQSLRLAPPLTITADELQWGLEHLTTGLIELAQRRNPRSEDR